MKIVIAPDSWKESLSASGVAQAIEKGFREIFPDALYVSVPVADGGEGTVDAMIAATQGTEQYARVTGPLGEQVNARWGMSGDGSTAFIEMAAASGLALVPAPQRNPLVTTSRGTGELILSALDNQQFALWMQPQVEMSSGKVLSAEALLRMQQPDGSWHWRQCDQRRRRRNDAGAGGHAPRCQRY